MTRIHPSYTGPLIFGGSAGTHLAEHVCHELGLKQGQMELSHFADGELHVKILDNVRGADVYLIQSTSRPVNSNVMELLLTIDALRRASAERISVVIPYFGYARQDRKDQGRVALSAKLMANLITEAGATRIICLDLHSPQIQGFFDIPMDHLYAAPVLLQYISQQPWATNVVVVSPDVGNVKMSRVYASYLNAPLAIIDKRRPQANVSEVMNIIGDVEDRHCLLIDDIVDTAGTLCNGAVALINAGALSVSACSTHGVLSGEAQNRIQNSPIERFIVTDSINQQNVSIGGKLHVVTIVHLLAKAIDCIHNFRSVSAIFNTTDPLA